MLATYARSQYQEMQVQTTPGKLVVMLYDGAIRFLHLGLDALRRGDLEAQALNLSKAQNILGELVSALDFSAGEMATNLLSLYHYFQKRLLIANAEDRADYIEEVIELMTSLREAWDFAERALRCGEGQAPEPALAGSSR
jgi:flagellar protein FliS